MRYPVNDIYACIQGEGVQTGRPMVMLRLHGCGVGCPWCDTKETWETLPKNEKQTIGEALGKNPLYTLQGQSEIVAHIKQTYPSIGWVLISGGEPATYPLKPLVTAIHDTGLKCAIETSGTETGHIEAGIDWVCVSPKFNMPGGKQVLPEAVTVADEIKQVVGKQENIDILDSFLSGLNLKPECEICLQPVSTSEKATELCIQTVQRRSWRLSIQMHKYIGIK